MLNERLFGLSDYPFARLAALLKDVPPAAGMKPIDLSIGEPKFGPPAFVKPILDAHFADYGRYPPVPGSPELRQAMAAWLARRYRLPAGLIDPDKNIVPLAGTREGLFMLPLAVVPERKAGAKPLILMPNPFYQVYKGGALAAGAEPYYMEATAATGFLPDLDSVPDNAWPRVAVLFLCTPSNPQGAVADRAYLARAIALARKHDFVLAVDECYAEIYGDAPPTGGLEAATLTGLLDNVVVFHSLSKRSSSPGLRSGFCAGDAKVIALYKNLRSYAAAGTPFAAMAAATALWQDESHVSETRARYQASFEAAGRSLGNRFGYRKPGGGFFLWLDVGDGEAATRTLWEKAAVKVLPGAYLAHAEEGAANLGSAYIRLALVHDAAVIGEAAGRIAAAL